MNLLSRFGGRVWDPLREIGHLQQEMGRMLSGSRPLGGSHRREYPPVNLYVNEHDLRLTTEVTGIDPEKVEITVTGGAVTIAGDRSAEELHEGESFHRRERASGRFERTLQLPFEVDPDKTEASYRNGVLSIRLARPDSQKPKKVAVKAN